VEVVAGSAEVTMAKEASHMNDLIDAFNDACERLKVAYGDIRVVGSETESITVKNENVEELARSADAGFGVRVLHKGCWGFACSREISASEVERVTRLAVEIAEASALSKREDVRLVPEEKHVDTWRNPFEEDPFKVSLEEKISLLLSANKAMGTVKGVTNRLSFFNAFREIQTFANTEGSLIKQEIVECGGGIQAVAVADGDMQVRSYPNSFRGQFHTAGFEVVRGFDLVGNAPRIAEEAVQLLSADECPDTTTTLILDGNQLGLQIHESIGHPIELDRVLGYEAAYAGMSFLTLDKLGNFRYGSEIMHITADATLPKGLGSFGYDDDGVPAQRVDIVKGGIFLNYLTNRETAHYANQNRSNGANRADGWNRIPIIRMTNINLEPGEGSLAELIADTKEGVFMSTNRSWSIDDRRLNFQFGCEIAWEIKDGKLGKMLKNPTYTGITPVFWGSMDRVCGKEEWRIWGTPNCGKGQPSQTAHVGHGASPARFLNVRIGIRG